MKKITIEQMVKTALFLTLLFVAKYIQKFIPDLPNGLGDITVLIEIIIIVGSIVIGWQYALFAILIYLFIGLIDIPTFFGGLLWVKGITKFEVYLLDYFFPLMVLSFAGMFRKTYMQLMLNIIIVNIINYIFHIWSGVVFWGSYSWEGWGPWTYSIAANGIRNSVMLGVSIIISSPAWKVPKEIFVGANKWI